jgi:hypothetical protein
MVSAPAAVNHERRSLAAADGDFWWAGDVYQSPPYSNLATSCSSVERAQHAPGSNRGWGWHDEEQPCCDLCSR